MRALGVMGGQEVSLAPFFAPFFLLEKGADPFVMSGLFSCAGSVPGTFLSNRGCPSVCVLDRGHPSVPLDSSLLIIR